jgi:hypothetical protein
MATIKKQAENSYSIKKDNKFIGVFTTSYKRYCVDLYDGRYKMFNDFLEAKKFITSL